MQGYIVSNNCPTIIIIINCNITNDLWFLYYPWLLLTLIGMSIKKKSWNLTAFDNMLERIENSKGF